MNKRKTIKTFVSVICAFAAIFFLLIIMGCSKKNDVKVYGTREAVEVVGTVDGKLAKGEVTAEIEKPSELDFFPPNDRLLPNIALKTPDFKKAYVKDIGSVDDFLTAKPVIHSGKIYTLNSNGELRAYKTEDGEEVSRLKLKKFQPFGAGLALAGNRLIVTGGEGKVLAVPFDLSKILWETNVGAPIRVPAVSDSIRAYVQTKTGDVLAVSTETGKEIWRRNILFLESAPFFGAEMTLIGSSLVIGTSTGEALGFQTEIGQQVFAQKIAGTRQVLESDSSQALSASVLLKDGLLIAAAPKNLLTAIRTKTEETVWNLDKGTTITPLWIGNVLYMVSSDQTLIALNAKTGKVYFEKPIDTRQNITGLIMVQNHIVVVGEKGKLMFHHPKTGAKRFERNLEERVYLGPVAADETLFILTNKGKLHAFR